MKCIGNYALGRTIGSGTFGKVKLATHIPTQQQVAIKIMNKERMVDIVDIERVQRELHILKIMRHPNIIMLYEVLETTKYIFLVMEYCQKELFSYIVKSKKLPEVNACVLFQQLLSGIEYLHKLKIVHRDIKPENLLIKGRLKIVDFGLSNTYQDVLKTACGSPCYAAPEMISGKMYDGLKADLWSCGVVLFVMLCGYLPFEDANTNALYKKILAANYKLPSFLSGEAADIINFILNPDPDVRPNIDQIRKHPWFNLHRCAFQIKQGIIIGSNKIPIDGDIVDSMVKLGYDKQYVYQCINANEHNDATTSYYLLLDQHLSQGNKSNADIASDQFQSQLLDQNLQTINSEIDIDITSCLTEHNATQAILPKRGRSPRLSSTINNASKTERNNYPERMFKLDKHQRSKAESEARSCEYSKISIDSQRNSKSIQYSDHSGTNASSIHSYQLQDRLVKELPLPPIPQQLRRKKYKLMNTLKNIQVAYGIIKQL